MTIKINGKDYDIKTSYSEFTIDEYLPLVKAFNLPLIERVSKYTGIPVDILNSIPVSNFSNICELVSFVEQEEILNALAERYELKDVGLEPFGKIEKAKNLIQGDIYANIIKVAELYTGETISGTPLLKSWHKVRFYMTSIGAFFEKFKRLSLHEYTDEELEADVELLEGFKHYPIVFKYGKNRGMTNDEVLALPAIEIYTELLYDFEQSEYEKRYHEVIKQRQEHFSKLK